MSPATKVIFFDEEIEDTDHTLIKEEKGAEKSEREDERKERCEEKEEKNDERGNNREDKIDTTVTIQDEEAKTPISKITICTKTAGRIDLYTRIEKDGKRYEEEENNREIKGCTNMAQNEGFGWLICAFLVVYIAWLQYEIQIKDNKAT